MDNSVSQKLRGGELSYLDFRPFIREPGLIKRWESGVSSGRLSAFPTTSVSVRVEPARGFIALWTERKKMR